MLFIAIPAIWHMLAPVGVAIDSVKPQPCEALGTLNPCINQPIELLGYSPKAFSDI